MLKWSALLGGPQIDQRMCLSHQPRPLSKHDSGQQDRALESRWSQSPPLVGVVGTVLVPLRVRLLPELLDPLLVRGLRVWFSCPHIISSKREGDTLPVTSDECTLVTLEVILPGRGRSCLYPIEVLEHAKCCMGDNIESLEHPPKKWVEGQTDAGSKELHRQRNMAGGRTRWHVIRTRHDQLYVIRIWISSPNDSKYSGMTVVVK
ncbi:hypothetical protein TIFTF001_018749 [Ficus carica]|uniref:Uncharacterized protein n=1 Tax=Ficus carica TaxID=3494 RepID=A0AA88DBZ3_FICCA|nr:hypothetical protein TIFTF001_018749 [Ficus carica]